MQELIHDSFYEILDEYDRLTVDFCLMENEVPNHGYSSHKEAVLYAIHRLNERYPWISIAQDKAVAELTSSETLFSFPEQPWKEDAHGTIKPPVHFSDGGKIPYWYAFLAPPHGTGPVIRNGKMLRKKYGIEDFELVNRALFPKGICELEIYDWSTDWSNYFDAGHEWWGTMCYSVYDKQMNRYVVIMASSTD